MRGVSLISTLLLVFLLSSAALFALGEESLRAKSTILEIESSSVNELSEWVLRLGLASGSSEEMRSALYAYYRLEKPEIQVQEDSSALLTIHSADSLIFSSKRIALLSGNVEISYTDTANGFTYEVNADKIILNQETEYVTAVGNVLYRRIDLNNEGVKQYECSSFSLSLRNWTGTVSGVKTHESRSNSKNESIELFLSGKETVVTESGQLLIKQGTVSTAAKKPLLSIQARELRFLTGGDWFAAGAVVYLGRIPILPIPCFFYPGVPLFFHPVFGTTTDRGYFINTTIMVFGERQNDEETEKSTFSLFLQGNENEGEGAGTLGISSSLLAISQKFPRITGWAEETGSYLAGIVDVYEQTGTLIGYEFLFQKLGFVTTFSGQGGAVFDFRETESPFRLFLENEINLQGKNGSFTASFPFYTDRTVLGDFHNHRYSFSVDDITKPGEYGNTSSISEFAWSVGGNYRLRAASLPFLSDISLSQISSKLVWSIDTESLVELSSADLVSQSFSAGGKLFDHRFVQTDEHEEPEEINQRSEPKFALSAPSEFREAAAASDTDTRELMKVAQPALQVTSVSSDTLGSLSLAYRIRESGTTDLSFSENEPEFISVYQKADATITFSGRIGDTGLTITDVLKPSGKIQLHRSAGAAEVSESTEETDKENTEALLYHELKLSLPGIPLTYTLSNRLARLYYSTDEAAYLTDYLSWTDEEVLNHSLSGEVNLEPLHTRISLSAELPPLKTRFIPKLTFTAYPFTLSVKTALSEAVTGGYDFDPLVINLSLRLDSGLSAAINSKYSFEEISGEGLPLSMTADIKIPVIGALRMSQYLSFDFSESIWQQWRSVLTYKHSSIQLNALYNPNSSSGTIPEFNSLKIYSRINFADISFWKNRVTFNAAASSAIDYSFTNPEENLLTFNLDLDFSIAEFLSLKIIAKSRNSALYKYVNRELNVFTDLLKSFNFFNIDDRYESNFNLSEISVAAVHYMSDWNLNVDYTGKIALNSEGEYKWDPEVSIFVTWKAIPEIDLSGAMNHDSSSGTDSWTIE